jgi:hypothetical protein
MKTGLKLSVLAVPLALSPAHPWNYPDEKLPESLNVQFGLHVNDYGVQFLAVYVLILPEGRRT